jgi:competence protein ComEA
MTKEESRAVAFVGVLLCLATVARLVNRPQPITITAAPVDVAAFRAAGQALAQHSPPPRPRPQYSKSGPIDINHATEAELEGLPGIGPAVAKRIVAYRDSAGRFAKVEDLDSVKGIGPALLEKVRPLVVAR